MNTANEPAFRQVPDWPQYEVNNEGVVRSWLIGGTRQQRRRSPLYRKICVGKDGYARVTFHERTNGVQRVEAFLVHRLVAICFLPTNDQSLDVAHLDGNRLNNNYFNLRWCTRKENESHKIIHGTRAIGKRNGQSKLCERCVRAIRILSKYENDQKVIAEMFAVSQQNISAIVSKKSRKYEISLNELEKAK
jgi:hypothetical protein